MIRGPPRFTRTDTLFPYTTLCRSRGFVDGQAERRRGVALALVIPGAPRLLGCDVAPFDPGDIVARIVAPAFHRADIDLRGGEIVPQHRLLVVGVGEQLGEGRVGRSLCDQGRGDRKSVVKGKSVSVRVVLGGSGNIKTNINVYVIDNIRL